MSISKSLSQNFPGDLRSEDRPQRGRYAMRVLLTSLTLIGLLPIAQVATAEDLAAQPAQKQRRIIYNNDGSSIFFNFQTPAPGKTAATTGLTAAKVRGWVDEVAGTQVDTYMICPNMCMRLAYPSKVVRMLGAGEDITKENGYDENIKVCAENIVALVEQGHDPLGLVIDRAKEKGMEIFVTYRMNEAHKTHIPESAFNSKFWRDHPEWRVGTGPYEQGALNYAIPELPICDAIQAGDGERRHTADDYRRIARELWGKNIDGIYLFNFLKSMSNTRLESASLDSTCSAIVHTQRTKSVS